MNIKKITNYNFLYDFVDDILKNTHNSELYNKKITHGIRELIAVKNVVLMQVSIDSLLSKNKEYKTVSVCPARNSTQFENNPTLHKLAKYSERLERFYNYNEDKNQRHSKVIKSYLNDLNTDSCIIFPLKVGKHHVGVLILLGILSEFRMDMILEAIEDITKILALIIRSTSLFTNLEFLVDKKTEEVLQSEKRFRKLFENSLEMIHIINTEGIIVDANYQELSNLGYSKNEFIGNNLDFIVSDRFRDTTKDKLKEVLRGKNINLYETELVTKQGKVIPAEVNAFPLYDKNDQIVFAVAVIRDVSERKNTEKILLQDQRLKAMGEVSAGIAHDFNNVLQGIISRTDALISDPGDKDHLLEYLNSIKNSALSTADRVSQLMVFSSSKGNTPSPKNVALINEVLSETIDLAIQKLKQLHIENCIKISLNSTGERIIVKGSKGNLVASFFNIIKNSIESICNKGSISVNITVNSKYSVITIKDNGSGMDETTASKIFDPFFSTKEFGKGIGLGMSSTYATIKNLGGDIYIKETKPNIGTTFEILLPLYLEKFNADYNATPSLKKENKKCDIKILWVDDDDEIREMGKILLEILGYKAETVPSAKHALEALSKAYYDIVITDIGMPKINGWELAKIITEKYPKIKIAVLSGWNHESSYNIKGIKVVIQKPITKDKLDSYIKQLISQ